MDIQIIENTIDELEHSDISMNNAIELASLYIIRNNNLTGINKEETGGIQGEIEDILPAKEENGNLIVQLDQGIFPWRVNCSYKHFNEGYAFVDINGNKFPDELKVSCWAYLKEKCS